MIEYFYLLSTALRSESSLSLHVANNRVFDWNVRQYKTHVVFGNETIFVEIITKRSVFSVR